MKINLEKLYQKAAERPLGYLEETLAAGTIKGGWLYLTPTAARSLRVKYGPVAVSRPSAANFPPSHLSLDIGRSPKFTGLGDLAAFVAKPIARVIDRIAGTDIENCKPCAKRQAKLNAAMPFKKSESH